MLITTENWQKPLCILDFVFSYRNWSITVVALLTYFRITEEEQNQGELDAFHFPVSEFGLHTA